MRKIIFRGKRIGSGEWVHGGIVPAYHEAADPMAPEEQEGYSILADGRAYAVDQESIGQYTGLNDKNGKPIYEDDLVEAMIHTGALIGGRVRFGQNAPTAQTWHYSVGWWIELAGDEFLRKELGFWAGKITVIGPWADQPRTWDRWCEEAAALERALQDF